MSVTCPKCGAVYHVDLAVCMSCGRKLKKKNERDGIAIGLFGFLAKWTGRAIILALALGAVCWWLLRADVDVPEGGEKKEEGGVVAIIRSALKDDKREEQDPEAEGRKKEGKDDAAARPRRRQPSPSTR